MDVPTVLFVNCTLKPTPEVSNTEALWQVLAEQYHQRECQTQSIRVVDAEMGPEEEHGEGFLQLFTSMRQANIVIVGTPVRQGRASSPYQRLIERLQQTQLAYLEPGTGQLPLYNTVFGLVLVGDSAGGLTCAADICYDFNQLGCLNPPQNVVPWCQPMDTEAEFIEAEGHLSIAVNQAVRVLADNSLAIAQMLRQTPLATNLRDAAREARALVKAATVERGALVVPKSIGEAVPPGGDRYSPHHTTKRIWTVMQEGIRRGFDLQVISLEDRLFRAERDGKGFIYKIYPGHYSFRSQYADYDAEQFKSRKLDLMSKYGLPVPVSYGTFQTFAEMPLEQLVYPLVAKPNSGSLSQNVFTNLQTVEQLKQAATEIEAGGGVIKLESYIAGWDFRVLIINHQYAGCVQRRPARIVGDGSHTVLELFQRRNQEPGRGDRDEAHTTIHQLVFDGTSRRLLHQAGYTLNSVLAEGEILYLQEKITASTGSDYVDYTDQLHPSIIQSCVDFSHHFSTLTLGFDLITTDISRPLAETQGAFNEYNFLPYIDLHENCNVGQKRPVSRLIWDYIEAHADQILTSEFKPF